MDGTRFDDLARALALSVSRRGALAGLAALLGMAEGAPVSARRRRGCRPKCGEGFACENRACVCPSGVACAGACCATGQACEGGTCVTPEPPPACIPPGQPCKGLGRACCDGRTCASGPGGKDDVACYVPAGGPCAGPADCVYGARCREGACVDTFTPCTVCAAGCPYRTIEAALADPALDVIRVGAGTYRPDDGVSPGHRLAITRSVTIEACGDGPVTIDGDRAGGGVAILPMPAGGPLTVALRNLAIVNGRAVANGEANAGGIDNYNMDGDTTLDGVTVADCVNEWSNGGGIFNSGGARLLVTGSSVIRDNASVVGWGGGIYNDLSATMRIEGRTVVRGNRAILGGGVFNAERADLALAGQVSVTGNVATQYGGGVVFQSQSETCEGSPRVCGNDAPSSANCLGIVSPSCAALCCPDG